MQFVTDNRASRILYNILRSNHFEKPFILPANVCGIVPNTFKLAQIPFAYADIHSKSLCIDCNKILTCCNNFSGMLYIHTYGVDECPEQLFASIKERNPNFFIIDDACLCMPTFDTPKTKADVRLFSVGPKKQVAMKCGGFAYLSDKCDYFIHELPNYDILEDTPWTIDEHIISQMIQVSSTHKKRLNKIYHDLLPSEIQLPIEFQNWRFNIVVENKDSILGSIFQKGYFASSHYRSQATGRDAKQYPNVDFLASHVINLFNDLYYTEEMAIQTCEIINCSL